MNLYLFNGPPGSGKDTAGKMLSQILQDSGGKVRMLKFSMPLKLATHSIMAIFNGTPKIEGPDTFEGPVKDVALESFFGVSPRQAYITLSEKFAKGLWGPGFFGELMARQVAKAREDGMDHVIITDCGFKAEIQTLMDLVEIGDAFMLHMHRDGCDFSKDSRGYVTLPELTTVDIHNHGSKSRLRTELLKFVESTVGVKN